LCCAAAATTAHQQQLQQQQRLTASEAVVHPWLLSKDVDLAARNLDKNLEQLKLFNARRKLRAAIKSVMAANKIATATGMANWN
jgi:hypothetical protein